MPGHSTSALVLVKAILLLVLGEEVLHVVCSMSRLLSLRFPLSLAGGCALVFLLTTTTLVPVTIIPPLVIVPWPLPQGHHHRLLSHLVSPDE